MAHLFASTHRPFHAAVFADDDDIEFDEADLPKVSKKIVSDTNTQTDADTLQREELVCADV